MVHERVKIGPRTHAGTARITLLVRYRGLNQLGELRDQRFEHQRYRASGLNLAVAAIVLWNTVYLEWAVQALCDAGATVETPCCRTSRRWGGRTST